MGIELETERLIGAEVKPRRNGAVKRDGEREGKVGRVGRGLEINM